MTEIEQICIDYLGLSVNDARNNNEDYCRLLYVLSNVKRWTISKIARELNSRTDTIERHLNFKPKPKPLSKEMEARMKRFLKIEHVL